uniref:Uncharacterized protein n=1 Tax=Anguilla anguilla TaxID=7936 RepID=A0A0E9U093_ANGAN
MCARVAILSSHFDFSLNTQSDHASFKNAQL